MLSVRALRSSNFKIIIGTNNYAGWYQHPKMTTPARAFRAGYQTDPKCRISPDDAPIAKAPAFFDLDKVSGVAAHLATPATQPAL